VPEAALETPGDLAEAAHWPPAPALTEAAVLSVAGVFPDRRVSSAEIAERIGVSAEWIRERTGIESRAHAAGDDSLTALATEAGSRALAAAGVDPADVDLVLVASFTQDELLPNTAPLVAGDLGVRGAGACDLGAACTGFLNGLAFATAQIESGRAQTALVIGADLMTRVTDHSDRKTAGLFADGAGAAVIGAGGPGRIGRIILRSDSTEADCIVAGREERLIRMRGQDTFRIAVESLTSATLEALEAEGLELGEIDVFAYHQANARITQAVGERLGLPAEKVVDCIATQGNTSAATLPLALCHAATTGMLEPGARVLIATFGAGFIWGAGVLEWGGVAA
jgi:3-oxoacyl-[acyl-carrier-protein] synthase-3